LKCFLSLKLKIAKLLSILRNQTTADTKTLEKENEAIQKSFEELSRKCEKLERDNQDLERIMNEQSSLMKALNVRKAIFFIFLFLRDVLGCIALQ
jgi:uncharacterized membrane protein (DUF106 family)